MEKDPLSILVSQIGYRPEDRKTGIIRCSSFRSDVLDNGEIRIIRTCDSSTIFTIKNAYYWGEKWKIHFWVLDFAEVKDEGEYQIELCFHNMRSSTFAVRDSIFASETLIKTSVGQLERKTGSKSGWQDCGSDLRAVEGHAVQLLGLVDCFDAFCGSMLLEHKDSFSEHIRRGADYLVLCQREDGSFVSEYYTAQEKKSWILCMMATIALARAYETTGKVAYLDSAKKGWIYCIENARYTREEIIQEIAETRKIFGKYAPWIPPTELRCRDKLLVVWAGTELYKNTNDVRYKNIAVQFADEICENHQVLDYKCFESGIFGNFLAWQNSGMHQKSWEHTGWGYNCGAVLPDELSGFINLLSMFPEESNWHIWRYVVRQFAYGFLKASSTFTPFGIYPLGLFDGELRFFGPSWHGFNGMYGRIAAISMLLAHLFEDPDFEIIAVQNMQWVAGLNTGVEKENGIFEGISSINGVGRNFAKVWTNIEGSICNGFCANPQFKMEHLDDLEDRPAYFTTEDWIVHNGGWLSGLSRIEIPCSMKIKIQYRGRPVQADVVLRLPEERSLRTDSRGIVSTGAIPTLRKGCVSLNWNGFGIDCGFVTISGYKKVIVIDFADFLESNMRLDTEKKCCILKVSNRGMDATNIRAYIRTVGVKLSANELEDTLESGESKEYTFSYIPTDKDRTLPLHAYCEVAGNYSNAVCEIDWKEKDTE